mmetsp:Transcript_11122/g.26805  ORF Transcript_11122/g.26805 Transcript_11122/m.26805 type:complete len:406 (+) Transcript_11122:264-1481(+)|eukprot:CAMPEP_0113621890 /NCGR_PEP_ID=MMETSP0017_2-20120614/11202_1 /TAXON_ID=2856 /ORGANISM="Cylindrotheca closterium" /LENGTH=405 /DNA_ID=CAMNT_0000531677 /DNA_START=200 /DNA_END=1417 /DNA_ORIENTATION=+ /assembly_acc=CAM_ASM_000147
MGDRNQFVTQVNPTDVLFGRGSGPNDHEGNIRFRDVVSKRKAEYMSTNHRQTKATIAKDVVNTVYQTNGRFLKKLEASDLQKLGFPPSTEVYQIVDDDTVMEKAKQALRQNREKNAGNISPKPKKQPMAPPAAVINTADFAIPNFAGGLASHDMLEPLPIPGMGNAPPAAPEHARPQQNPEYAKYTQQLEGLAAASQGTGNSGEAMRRGNRRASVQSMSSKRDSLQLSQIMYQDADGMSAMMESFKGMSTTGEFASQDSIGTIENMFGDPQHQLSGISNMSLSSVFNEKSDKQKRPGGGRMSFTSSSRSKEALGETADWVFDEQSPSGEAAASLWPLEESRNSGAMLPPANRPLNPEQISASIMAEPLQESQSGGVMMSTGDIGMSTGSLMMTSIDSLGPLEEKK